MTPEAIATLMDSDRAAAGDALDHALRAGHDSGDTRAMLALHRLAIRYWQADTARCAFHRTHAYVYALEAGEWAAADSLNAELAAEGRM